MLTGRNRHEDIRNLYVNHLAYIWMEDSTTEATRISVAEKVDSFAEGELEHAKEILSALWEIANKDTDVKPQEETSSTVSPFRFYSPCHSAYLASPDPSGHESCPLGRCEDRVHQVDSQRCFL